MAGPLPPPVLVARPKKKKKSASRYLLINKSIPVGLGLDGMSWIYGWTAVGCRAGPLAPALFIPTDIISIFFFFFFTGNTVITFFPDFKIISQKISFWCLKTYITLINALYKTGRLH